MELSKQEKRWLNRLQKVLDECPSDRIGFYTIGDPSLSLYDRRQEQALINSQDDRDFCSLVREAGADINYRLDFPSHIHSTSG